MHAHTLPSQTKRTTAFTLIELLVVIVIIAILAALIAPAAVRAKESARTAVCLNNNKEISLATALYAEDNRFRIPSFVNWLFEPDETNGRLTNDLTTGRIYRYLTTKDIYMCPTDRATFPKQPNYPRMDRGNGYGGRGLRQNSYGMTCTTCHYNDLAKWKIPSQTAMYTESLLATNDCSGIGIVTAVMVAPPGRGGIPPKMVVPLAFRHRAKAFAIKGDFSVQTVRDGELPIGLGNHFWMPDFTSGTTECISKNRLRAKLPTPPNCASIGEGLVFLTRAWGS